MDQHLLRYKSSTISYYCFGQGPAPALCFHGYGENAKTFEFLAKYAGNQYTFYSIDLPFHGETDWKEGLDFTAADLSQIVEEIIREGNFRPHPDRFPHPSQPNRQLKVKLFLIGYSLGGRIALGLLQQVPEQIEKMILLAPDGLKVNFWYWLATQTWPGNKFFSFTMKKPGWFFGFLKLLNKMGLVNASIFKFVNYYIGDKTVRQLLFQRWTTLRKIKPDITLVKSLIKKNNIAVRLLYGKHDRIILSSTGEKFRKEIKEQCSIHIIHAGHQILHEKHIDEILPALLH